MENNKVCASAIQEVIDQVEVDGTMPVAMVAKVVSLKFISDIARKENATPAELDAMARIACVLLELVN